MMLSVSRHSSRKVKFWLFENYLSPSFKQSAAVMAQQFGFEVRNDCRCSFRVVIELFY